MTTREIKKLTVGTIVQSKLGTIAGRVSVAPAGYKYVKWDDGAETRLDDPKLAASLEKCSTAPCKQCGYGLHKGCGAVVGEPCGCECRDAQRQAADR